MDLLRYKIADSFLEQIKSEIEELQLLFDLHTSPLPKSFFFYTNISGNAENVKLQAHTSCYEKIYSI
ncbi:hypothetical protein RDI58_026846 [Solanum bulbocastanum]|uniref:Uncharacterized protein n=1 Tax=Solanum bulbocastanum TaxID=147425 RepID=A0AAN8SWN0_SOLBU